MKLFANSKMGSATLKGPKTAHKDEVEEDSSVKSDNSDGADSDASEEENREEMGAESSSSKKGADSLSFEGLGLSEWVCKSVAAMGFRQPTPVQQECIPAILSGHDVIGCAETGSGKTAAFALPILDHLSKDPFGIFGVILTPTRELGAQISEQFVAFGAPIGLRIALIIGGVNMTEQSLALKRLPHVIIATPGRLRAHLEGPDPPTLSKTPYLVLDEADRLLSQGFSSELGVILSAMTSKKRKTFLFSATMTDSLAEVEKLAMSNTLQFNLTSEQRVPSQLLQQYLFMPAQVKMNYLVAVLNKVVGNVGNADERDNDGDTGLTSSLLSKSGKKKKKGKNRKGMYEAGGLYKRGGGDKVVTDINAERTHSSSVIIFAGTCRKCQETNEILRELGYETTVLHSMMTQPSRTLSLSNFKNQRSRILIATDVASRGLDIPEVDLVINLDLPRVAEDYIHRVGRTARAGKAGRALALVTQYDVEMVHGIEDYMGLRLQASDEVSEDDVVALLNVVSKATRLAQMNLLESGFDEKDQERRDRKRINGKSRSISNGKRKSWSSGRDDGKDQSSKRAKGGKLGKGVTTGAEMAKVMEM